MLSPASGNLPFNGRGRAKSRVELGHRCRGLVRSLQAKCYQSSKRFRCGKGAALLGAPAFGRRGDLRRDKTVRQVADS